MNKHTRTLVAAALVLLVAGGAWWASQRDSRPPSEDNAKAGAEPRAREPAERPGTRPRRGPRPRTRGEQQVIDAYRDHRSGFMVELDAIVVHLLLDDNKGRRHQQFIVKVAGGPTLKVAHNIDLAPRVPTRKGDRVRIRGQYEWNDKGGVLHWTHHDPRGRRAGGWIEHGGRRYK